MAATSSPKPPKFPWRIRIASALSATICHAASRCDGAARRRFLSLLDTRVPPNPVPVNGVATFDYVVDPTRNLSVRHFSPTTDSDSSTKLPSLVYFHGGGFVQGSPFSRHFDSFGRLLSRRIPANVISVDYRLAPEHKFPAAYDDGANVLHWLDNLGGNIIVGDHSSVFIAGDSAGGNIAHHVTRRTTTTSYNRLSVSGLLAIQPFFGSEEDTDSERRLDAVPFGGRKLHKWMWRAFLPEGSSLDHEASNVFGPGSASASEDWSRFPPTMVAVGRWDILQDRDRWYYQGLKKAGVEACLKEYSNATHAFYVFPKLRETLQLAADLAEFVRKWSE